MNFRYAITSQAQGDAATLGMRLGESVGAPLVAAVVPLSPGGHQMAASGSLCAIERPEVRLVQATASHGGGELLLWLDNLAGGEVVTGVEFPDMAVTGARLGTVFEDDQVEVPVVAGSVRVRLKAGETKALALPSTGARLWTRPAMLGEGAADELASASWLPWTMSRRTAC